ncbi:carcinoembryonic antigen-related cell adhesion molecule 6-like isoform X2 [Mugil cephalus]|uniref:carcinoembryonic antigen-related cell adhesion molecule 6-like isoform X2 n=1 Tax=Mugil cephalus TaxID=48193 RepID=UPI001FB578B5|nr:carcinoembryonic antigen-related cell adhesion molecule 6-like isoform X2 [Mugil cephalus]
MEKVVICIILLGIISGVTEGAGVLPGGPLNAAVGEKVTFTTTLTPPEKPFISVSWNFGDRNIITSSSGNFTSAEYEDRITYFPSTGSLELRDLTLNDSGVYRVSIIPYGGPEQPGTIRLDVYEKISGASLHPSTNISLMEGNSFTLTCEASGSIVTRNWRKDGSALILTDNNTLHDNNRVLMFNTVTRKDSGEYFCNIRNPISSDGAKYNMMVNYGPEKVQITGPSQIHLKETFKLTCSAESTPAATYTWMFNGSEILKDSAEFIKEAELSDSGSYTCQATNDITGRTSLSVEHGLTVTDSKEAAGLSAGAIAGIVIACLIVCCAGAAGGFYMYKRK